MEDQQVNAVTYGMSFRAGLSCHSPRRMRSLLPTDRRRPRHVQVWLWLVATLRLLPVSASRRARSEGAADSTGSRLAASSAPPVEEPTRGVSEVLASMGEGGANAGRLARVASRSRRSGG